jgi:hypothetical protein
MKFSRYILFCLAVASCAPALCSDRRVTTAPSTPATIAKFLTDNGVNGGWILSRKVSNEQICVATLKCPFVAEYREKRERFNRIDQIIAELPKLVALLPISWLNPLNWFRAPQYQATLYFKEQPWYKKMLGFKEKPSSFCIRCDNFAPAGTIVKND